MLNHISRNLCAGALCITVALAQSVAPGATAIAQNDDPTPKPPLHLELEKENTPDAPSVASSTSSELFNARLITPTREFEPEQAVRDILEQGRAILYPGHVITPTETPDDTSKTVPNATERNSALAVLSGTVIVSDTGLPINFVRVVAYNARGVYDYDFTDRQGKFSIYLYDSEQYVLRVDPAQVYPYDLAGEWYDDQTLSNTATLISTAVELTHPLSIVLDRGGQITGTVVASDTGVPLVGMTLAVYDANGTFIHSVLSDEVGRYTTSGLRSGAYKLCAYAYYEANMATRRQYPGSCYDNQPTRASATALTVTAPNTLPDITVAVLRSGQITGVVTAGDSGAPLAGVEVGAISKNGGSGSYTVTNAAGQYVLDGLQSGAYVLYFSSRYGPSEISKYLSEYYNNKQTHATADVISLTASATLSNVNAVLDVGARITGVVTAGDTHTPLSSIEVYLFRSSGSYVDYVTTNALGEYGFSNLPTDQYKIYFSTRRWSSSSQGNSYPYFGQYYSNTFTWATANTVLVTVGQIRGGINVSLDRGGQITGVVTAGDTGRRLGRVSVRVYRASINRQFYDTPYADLADPFYANTLTDAQGQYTITAPGGLLNIAFQPYNSLAPYCGQYYNQRATSMRADAASVTPGQVTTQINAILNRTSRISGTVTSADNGAPLEDVSVRLYPIDWLDNSFIYAAAYDTTDAQGRYEFGPICAGDYKLSFSTSNGPTQTALHAPQYYNQKLVFREGDSIALSSNVTLTINAALPRMAQITGTVKAADTGGPIYYAYVDVFDLNGNYRQYTPVSFTGIYTLNLAPGSYKLRADAWSDQIYADEFYGGTTNFGEAITLVVGPKQVLGNIAFTLQHGGVITGQVTDEDTGLPVVDARVLIYEASNPNFVVSSAYSNRYGIYTSQTRLRAGNYKARILRSSYVSQYFGGQTDFDSASPISVTENVTTTQINVRLLSIYSPKLITNLRMPIAVRPAPELILIEPTPITIPSTPVATFTRSPTFTPVSGQATATRAPTTTPNAAPVATSTPTPS